MWPELGQQFAQYQPLFFVFSSINFAGYHLGYVFLGLHVLSLFPAILPVVWPPPAPGVRGPTWPRWQLNMARAKRDSTLKARVDAVQRVPAVSGPRLAVVWVAVFAVLVVVGYRHEQALDRPDSLLVADTSSAGVVSAIASPEARLLSASSELQRLPAVAILNLFDYFLILTMTEWAMLVASLTWLVYVLARGLVARAQVLVLEYAESNDPEYLTGDGQESGTSYALSELDARPAAPKQVERHPWLIFFLPLGPAITASEPLAILAYHPVRGWRLVAGPGVGTLEIERQSRWLRLLGKHKYTLIGGVPVRLVHGDAIVWHTTLRGRSEVNGRIQVSLYALP